MYIIIELLVIELYNLSKEIVSTWLFRLLDDKLAISASIVYTDLFIGYWNVRLLLSRFNKIMGLIYRD